MSDFVAIFASPRVLVVRITARCLQCTVVVAHAPHSGVDAADLDMWWGDLSRRLAGQPDVVLLVDANARLGSSVSRSVGGGGFCQQEGIGGNLFHSTLVELDLCVPAAFGPADPSTFTWVANGGACHRIDCCCSLLVGLWFLGGVASTLLPPGLLAAFQIPVLSVSSTLLATGRTTFLWPCAPLWSSGGRHAAPSGKLKALIVPPSRILSVATCSSAP